MIIARHAQNGHVTHNQLQSITLHSLRTTNASPKNGSMEIPPLVLKLSIILSFLQL